MPRSLSSLPLKPASSSPAQASARLVAEREGDLALALLQQVEVFDRALVAWTGGRLPGTLSV